MANISKLLMETKSLSATRDDPRNAWQFYSLPPSIAKRERARSEKKRTTLIQKIFSRLIENASKLQ